MNRSDLQALSETRLEDGTVLLNAGRFHGAYYMLGYSIECALKAAIAKQIREHDFPDKALANASFTHNLPELLKLSGLTAHHRAKSAGDRSFEANWAVVKDWSETKRYETSVTDVEAHDLYDAITDPASGVLPWLKTLW